MNTAETLRAAAARVRKGWCQHTLENSHGVCAIGAINVASHGDSHFQNNIGQIRKYSDLIARACGLPLVSIGPNTDAVVAWNNAPGQTAENVARGLELAAETWELQQAPAVEWTHRERTEVTA